MISAITELINNLSAFIDSVNQNADKIAGFIVGLVMICERIARLIPTSWDNKTVQWIARKIYVVFAIIGLKVPDIVKIDDGKMITKTQAVAQEMIINSIPLIESEPKK